MFEIMVAAGSAVVSGVIVAAVMSSRGRKKLQNAQMAASEAAARLEAAQERVASTDEQIDELQAEYKSLRLSHDEMLQQASASKAAKEDALRRQSELQAELENISQAKNELQASLAAAEKQVALSSQQVEEMGHRMGDWQKQQEEMTNAAKASLLKAGSEMSSKLLEDHKREAEEAKREAEQRKKHQEEQVAQTTSKLMEQFTEVTKSVAHIKQQSDGNKDQMELVMRALTNPSGAGQMAEVGLENSLKNLGLEVGRDFVMQYHIPTSATGEGMRTLRPDAVVFLPQNMVMVVDCKASKHVLELAEVEAGSDQEQAVIDKLKKTMHEHIRALGSKDYKTAVEKHFAEQGKGKHIGNMFNIMYVPNEAAIERLRAADPSFQERIDKAGVILAGAASLAGLFSLAKMNIAASNRAENEEKIIATLEDMLSSIGTAFGHIDDVGKGLERSVKSFSKFTKSVNRNLLPKMHKISKLGVAPKKGEIPAPLSGYEVSRADNIIEMSADGISADNPSALKLEESA